MGVDTGRHTQEKIEETFQIFCKAPLGTDGHPSFHYTAKEAGVGRDTVARWCEEGHWLARLDLIKEKVQAKIDDEIVNDEARFRRNLIRFRDEEMERVLERPPKEPSVFATIKADTHIRLIEGKATDRPDSQSSSSAPQIDPETLELDAANIHTVLGALMKKERS